jgi:hypothetical protein
MNLLNVPTEQSGTISMRKILRQDQELSSNGLMFT